MVKKRDTVTHSRHDLPADDTDWARVDALTDADIMRDIGEDPDAARPVDREWFDKAELLNVHEKQPVTIRLDADVVDWFKSKGRGYQSRINAALRLHMSIMKRER